MSQRLRNNQERALWRYLLLKILFIFALPIIVVASTAPSQLPFDPKPIADLNTHDPAYLFIGNSMVFSRIDAAHLSRLTGARVWYENRGGSASASWYLQLKNHVVPASARPKVIFLFFRGDTLTRPNFRIDGYYREKLEKLRHSLEPVFDDVTKRARPWSERISHTIESLFPSKRNNILQTGLNNLPLILIYGKGTKKRDQHLLNKINGLFAVKYLRQENNTDESTSSMRVLYFERELENSFLPHIIELAKEHKLPLHFVCVKSRWVAAGGGPLPADRQDYITKLRTYIENSGFRFTDLNNNSHISLDLYGRGDHISKKHKKTYTEIFYQALRSEFP